LRVELLEDGVALLEAKKDVLLDERKLNRGDLFVVSRPPDGYTKRDAPSSAMSQAGYRS
jgi:hypothetical protein